MPRVTRVIAVLVISLASVPFALAAELTLDDLGRLRQAGFSDSLIARKIQVDGISFDPSTQILIDLKQAGFSEAVLEAVLDASPGRSTAPGAVGGGGDVAVALAKQGKYAEAEAYLLDHLSRNAQDSKARALLCLTQLRLGKRAEAGNQIALLQASQVQGSGAAANVQRLELAAARWDSLQDKKNQIAERLQAFDSLGAKALIEEMGLSSLRTRVLLVYLAAYQGRFSEALAILDAASGSPESRGQLESLSEEIRRRSQESASNQARIDWFLYSETATSLFAQGFTEKIPDITSFSVPEYLDTVERQARLVPLAPHAPRQLFHAALLALPYPDLEEFGDFLLRTVGEVRIPAYSESEIFDLVIDARKAELRTELNQEHPYTGSYWMTGFGKLKHGKKIPVVRSYTPFNVSFREIVEVQQSAENAGGALGQYACLEINASALSVSPGGHVPMYMMMSFIHATYGARVQQEVTEKLGRFVLHALNNPQVRHKLVDPTRADSGGKGAAIAVGVLAVAAGAAIAIVGGANDPAMMSQAQNTMRIGIDAMIRSGAESGLVSSEQQRGWHQEMVDRALDFGDETFYEIEELLEKWV